MSVTYTTVILGFGNHAAIEIPDAILAELGTNKRAPLKVTVNGYTYQSTAAGMNGQCLVVFPQKDRDAAKAKAGDEIQVTLELDTGVREVQMPLELTEALNHAGLFEVFSALTYSKRKEFARQVSEAKTSETRDRRIEKVISALN
ncbi:MAG: hypothetical protein RLZZ380_527 [Actinomycetota bacterium]|jgi:uncharacterized protein YdeI (YjbR/CyaY-like superfamily)